MMAAGIMYQEDAYVVLASDQPEEVILMAAELQAKLEGILADLDPLPRELKKFTSRADQARHLMETGCELDLGPGAYLQWYVVRLER